MSKFFLYFCAKFGKQDKTGIEYKAKLKKRHCENYSQVINLYIMTTISYSERISKLTGLVNSEIVDFSLPRDEAHMPTQASSEFITNKEQGDWAEELLFKAINEAAENYIVVRYGKSDNLVAGDEHFDEFYAQYQEELDTIGKRPDLLIFKKSDYLPQLGTDISKLPHNEELSAYVKKAVAGIEVRSSAFLMDKYEEAIRQQRNANIHRAIELRSEILNNYTHLLSDPKRASYLTILNNLDEDSIHAISFKVPGWRSTPELSALNEKLSELKECIKRLQKRDSLSITPKVEDLKVVYKWIQCFNVPHYYFQVFFDKIYGISFEDILTLISDPEKEGDIYFIESDTKNQNKTTIKIRSNSGTLIAGKVDEPTHHSVRKELNRGRLLFYVSFEGGKAFLNIDNLKQILNFNGKL